MIRIETLGRTRVFVDDRELESLPSQPIRCGLLVYLAVERVAPRERLLATFWPEQDDKNARHALNQTLYELRKTLGEDWLKPNGEHVTITAAIQLDVDRFEEAIERADYRTALDLYQGGFLSEGPVVSARPFEEWVDLHAFKLRRAWIRAAQSYVGQLTASGATTDAIRVAREVVEEDAQEDLLQHKLIELLHAAGRRNEALEQYELYERALRADELEPLEETKALVARIRSGSSAVKRASGPAKTGSTTARLSNTQPPVIKPLETNPGVRSRLSKSFAGRYEIIGEIGSGGMATVYLAEDLKHRRRVALKVLRPELGAAVGPERFLSEINVTANLQHPHLLPLFDSGEADALLFYVMPYVEGESLRQRLERERQLPVEEAVRIAALVASALDYAHRHGVIHRDLKPENILLHEGEPLIADFGIALAVSNAGGSRVTRAGLAVGTPQYMSPEQAMGDHAIDARSDIYSLGAVLYEMLTGDPPHMGSTAQAVIARALNDRAQHVRVLRDTVPDHVDAAIMCALAKLPADRFLTAGEFAEALTGARPVGFITPLPHTGAHPVAAGSRQVGKRWALTALRWSPLVIAAVVLFAALSGQPPGHNPTLFEVTFSDSVQPVHLGGINIARSGDGSLLAFTGAGPGGHMIYLRRMGTLDARPIQGTVGGTGPQFSPDGTWLVFLVDGQVRKVPVGGGAPILIANGNAQSVTWGDRKEIVYGDDARLWRVAEDGGTATLLAVPDSSQGHLRYGWPHLLPGGKAALITIAKGSLSLEGAELGLVSLADGRVKELKIPGTGAHYLRSGHIVFGRSDGSLFAAPFALLRMQVTGPAVPVLRNVEVKHTGAVEIAISNDGDIVYKTVEDPPYRRLARVDRHGVARPLDVDSAGIAFPRIDPSGRRIALSIEDEKVSDVWTYDLQSRALTRLTNSGSNQRFPRSSSQRPEWSHDGRNIAYITFGNPKGSVSWQPRDGSGSAEVLIDTTVAEISLGPPGGYLAVRFAGPNGGSVGSNIWIAPVDSPGALRPFLTEPATERYPRVSPNGRVLAYVTDETGRDEVYIRPLPGPGGRVQVSHSGGEEPVWSTNGRELFYRSADYVVVAAAITEAPVLDVVQKDSLFMDSFMRSRVHANFDVFPSGKEFVFVETTGGSQRSLWGISRWSEELKRQLRKEPPR